MGDAKVPLHFIGTCSQTSLQSYELARLDAAARLRRKLQEVTDEWIEAEIEARLARWALERRRYNPQTHAEESVAIESLGAGVKSLPAPHRRIRRKPSLVASFQNPEPSIAYVSPSLPTELLSPVVLVGLPPSTQPQAMHNGALAQRSSLFRVRRLLRRRTRRF
ncbi:MAG TPA: hypothetical protein VIH76_15635 [Candidatus Acidoferrales bacterium]